MPDPTGADVSTADGAGTATGTDPVDLSTTYLGLPLRTPLVASAGPLTGRLETLADLAAQGVSAVVLPSLFEEQVIHDQVDAFALLERGAGANPEADGYFPELPEAPGIAERWLMHAREACEVLDVPVVGSLNGVSPGGWTRYAREIADVGVAALELNLYEMVTDPQLTGGEVEDRQLALVSSVVEAVDIPVAVKISPYYTAVANVVARLVDAGAAGVVLFNRFYQPDIDPDTREVQPSLDLSRSADVRLPLRWVAVLSGRVAASLAVSGGVHTGRDAARCVLAGADVVMMTSALISNGPLRVAEVERELVGWAALHGARSVGELRGSVSHRHTADPGAYERANYIGALTRYSNTFHDVQGFGPR